MMVSLLWPVHFPSSLIISSSASPLSLPLSSKQSIEEWQHTMYQPLLYAKQHNTRQTLNSYPHKADNTEEETHSTHSSQVELSGTSPVKQRCVTKSCVSGFQQILCQRGNPQRRLVSDPREGGQSSQILCNLCSHPGYQHQGQNPRMKPRIANN